MLTEVAVVVVALCMVVITVVIVVALLRVNAAARKIEKLAATLDAEVRPVARAVSQTADDIAEAMSVVRKRVDRTDDALDAITHRVVHLSDRLFTPLENMTALLHALGVGFRFLFRKRDS